MTIPLGPAGALKIAYELIDAQAAHIKALERGHWSRETRALVEDKRDELEAVQAAEEAGSCCAAGACDPCEREPEQPFRANSTEPECAQGFHPTSCGVGVAGMCDCSGGTRAALQTGTWHPAHDAWATPHPDNVCAPLFDQGGELPTGLTHVKKGDQIGMVGFNCQGQPRIQRLPDIRAGETLIVTHTDGEVIDVEVVKETTPEGHTGHHQEGVWPPEGQCPRCDIMQIRWDLEREEAARIRQERGGKA